MPDGCTGMPVGSFPLQWTREFLHAGVEITSLDVCHLDQIAKHVGLFLFRYLAQLSQHLADESDVLAGAGSVSISFCVISRHGQTHSRIEKAVIGSPNHTQKTITQ